jgi:chemotaxis protein methyltransferase CheR
MTMELDSRDWEDLEIDLLLQGVYHRYGFDFREYERGPLKGKLHSLLHAHSISSISALQDRILHDPQMGETFLCELNVRASALFDDPEHIRLLRKVAVPWLRSHPSPKIWIADCVSAEDLCTLAILLDEEKIYDKTQIFATGSNDMLLREASTGGVARARIIECAENHRQSGGSGLLSDYFGVDSERAVMLPRLRANITWAQFNLQTDASFNEFQMIICRRVLADFGATLQRRALHLFHESLPMFGLLSIDDSKEIEPPPFCNWYKPVCSGGNLYKRVV